MSRRSDAVSNLGKILLLLCLGANVLAIYDGIHRNVRFVTLHPRMGVFEKQIHGYPAIVKRYLSFLVKNIPPDAVVMIPSQEKPFFYIADRKFMSYLLSPRMVISQKEFDVRGDFGDWLAANKVTHLLMGRGIYHYWSLPEDVGRHEFEKSSGWLELVKGINAPACYMPEPMTLSLRTLKVAFVDGSTRCFDRREIEGFKILKRSMACKGFRRSIRDCKEEMCVDIVGEYSGGGPEINPEDRWGGKVDLPVERVETLSGEISASIPESACLFITISVGGEKHVLYSPLNSTMDAWETLKIERVNRDRAVAGSTKATVCEVGICLRPLGWGYLKVGT